MSCRSADYSIFTNIVGQDGILQRIGNPLGLRSGIDQADWQSAAD
jgi:hypothetical protein